MYVQVVVKQLVTNPAIAMCQIVIGTEIPSPNAGVKTMNMKNFYT